MAGKRIWFVISTLVLIGIALGIGYFVGRGAGSALKTPPPSETGGEPVASVRTVPVRQTKIEETIGSYGTVIAAPGKSETFSVPFESKVDKVLVAQGQVVAKGQPLVVVSPSPDTRLQYNEAKNELETARNQLKLTQQLIDLKLATRQDLVQAQQQVHSAELKVQSFKDRGVNNDKQIQAGDAGIVSVLNVQEGKIIPAGDVLLETIGENEIQIRLGIESEDVVHMHEGQTVRLYPVNLPGDSAFEGTIARITRQVNPDTRLVDVYITPARGIRLMLNDYVHGEIVIASTEGLVVPRAAVLPEDGSHTLFTVENGKAVRHTVKIGLENDSTLQVIDSSLQPETNVVVIGNSELHDGMPVRVEPGR